LTPRQLQPLIIGILDGGPPEHTSVYTGGGDEPYFEADTAGEPNGPPKRGRRRGHATNDERRPGS
jgi:hypothetical protein